MSDLFFKELDIPGADINFNINNLASAPFISRAAHELEAYFLQTRPSIVFIYGDTNTTAAAAIAAKKANIFLVHFEAGVRTGDDVMQEEINRITADNLANINLCCTEKNLLNLKAEGFGNNDASQVYLTGDLMLDAFNKFSNPVKKIVEEEHYVACTIHRAANITRNNLQQIVSALNEINKTIRVIFPAHPNTRKMIEEYDCRPSFKMLNPLGYYDMKSLLTNAAFVITDSGGACREAYFLQKPALIIMDHPFWPEIIEHNCAIASAADTISITNKFSELSSLKGNFTTNIFGDGNAAGKIRSILENINP